jgi:lysophospholipid acyltransferase (LPLAT)-like uncharacterized protein
VHSLRGLLGFVLGLVVRAWLATLRVEVAVDAALAGAERRPWVLAFFHGTQFPLLAWRRRGPTAVMVSWSRDGAMQARALGALGFAVVRGSTSRGGARGLAGILRHLRVSGDAAFAVDGPRGPYGAVHPGAAFAARATGAALVPMGSAVARGLVLSRAWDRFTIAWPFSRVVVVLGAPAQADDLASAIRQANQRAGALLAEEPVFTARSRWRRSRRAPPSEVRSPAP